MKERWMRCLTVGIFLAVLCLGAAGLSRKENRTEDNNKTNGGDRGDHQTQPVEYTEIPLAHNRKRKRQRKKPEKIQTERSEQ